jgi:single-stranded-DNA-specific exonuclease
VSVPTSWRIAPVSFDAARALATELGVSDTLAQILVRRGFTDPHEARAFLHPDYRVYDPYRMAGIAEARKRIDTALKRSEPIAVHGDYDADGITATFLMVSVLQQLGADVRSRLPNRFSEGYGVAAATVEELAAAGVKLLITVDCGIGARDEVALARSLGMDVIVTDHHEIEGPLPDCIVVTPKLPGYPCPHLAGVGVAFKLAHALLEDPGDELVELPLALRALTDVVAIGTVADIVPLVDENRALVAIGLGRLRGSPRPGLAALMEVAGVKADGINAGTVGFRLGPRLNAAGRLEDASLALDLLGSADRTAALPLALRLNELNQERQAIEAAMVKEAEGMVTEPLPPALVLSSPDWHEGVVGIVASRVAERFGRPVVLLSERGDEVKGSGRSIPGFDLLGAVEAGAEHLLAFGGHRAACGLRLRRDRLAQFRAAFVAAAGAALTDDLLVRTQRVDAVVCGDDLTLELADELELLAPHGMGNPKVGLLLHDAQIVAPRLTRDHKHLQYKVRCDGASCSAIHFNFSGLDEVSAPGRFDVPLSLGKNAFNGAVSVQVQVSGLHRLPDDAADLCATACDLRCERRLTGEALWRYLLDAPAQPAGPATPPGGDGDAASTGATMPARIHDRRGRPVVSSLTALAATGERVLVLVADVARRRPLLSRDVLPPQLGRDGMYVQCACASRVDEALAGPHVVMAGLDLAAAEPRLAAAFPHVAFVDPPFSRRLFADIAAAAPQAWIHTLWGRPEVDFATKVAATGSDLQAVSRGLWRALQAGSGRFDEGLELALLGKSTFLRPAGVLAAALRTLREADLLRTDGLEYELQRPAAKVDVTTTESYRTWHTRFQTTEYLRTCLTAPL